MRIRTALTGAAGLAAIMTLAGLAPALAGPARAVTRGGWRVAAAVPGGPGRAELTRVVATGPSDAWAVGVTCTSPCARGRLLVEHWDGTRWRRVRLPRSLPAVGYFVTSIGASSPRNVWIFAVSPRGVSLAVHWDGVSWTRPRLPRWFFPHAGAGPDGQGYLRTEVFGPRQVWVFDVFAPARHPFAAFWNGTSWEKRPLPMSPLAVTALSPRSMWVVGESGLPVTVNGGRTGPLKEAARHWDGHAWRTVPLPTAERGGGLEFIPVAAAAQGARSLWVQGTITSASTGPGPNQLLRWDGHRWTRIPAPVKGFNLLGAMSQDGHGGVWFGTLSLGSSFRTRLAHFGGGQWTVRSPPRYAGVRAVVTDLAWVPGTRLILAAGTTGPPVAKPTGHPAGVILEHLP